MVSSDDRRKPPAPKSVDGKAARRANFVVGGATKEREREKLTLYVDSDVATDLRVHCAQHRQEMSEVTTLALRAFLVKE